MSSLSTRKDLGTALGALDARLGRSAGKRYWRSLEELAGDEAFQQLMRQEFPEQADVWPDALSRRKFLALMGASLALAGLNGCSVRPTPTGTAVPYVKPPREIVPGKPLFFATSMVHAGSAVGVLVESHMGRPTKIEGNPEHPASLGATDIYQQASILTLYDPDRSQTVTHLGRTRTWDEALAALRAALDAQKEKKGAGLRILSESIASPTLARQRDALLKEYPEAQWHLWEPLNRDNARRGAELAFGKAVDTRYDFTKADVVLSLDADFLGKGPGNLRHVSEFMSLRRPRDLEARMMRTGTDTNLTNRLYVVETSVSCTGAKADHRLAMRAAEIESFARAVAARCGVGRGGDSNGRETWVSAIAEDLKAHRGTSLVIAGDSQPPAVHLLAHALNQELGNVGQTVFYTEPLDDMPLERTASLRNLVDNMEVGKVDLLVILGGNPVYNAPADFRFVERMQKVPLRVQLGLFEDETARQCHWHLPEAHFLEAWSDARAYDGTRSVVQPLIEPLYAGRSVHELLGVMIDGQLTPGYEIVRDTWRRRFSADNRSGSFDDHWESVLHDGLEHDTASSPLTVKLVDDWQNRLGEGAAPSTEPSQGYELVFEPDPTIYDGSYANNGWLQELPKPISKLTWDNAATMSPKTAADLGIDNGSYAHGGEHGGYHMPVVELKLGGRRVKAPVWIVPGQADGSISVQLGYGRRFAGRVGGTSEQTVGFDAYLLRTSSEPWFAAGLEIVKTGETQLMAGTQQHHSMEGRELVRVASLDEFRKHHDFAKEPDREREHENSAGVVAPPLTLYKPFDYSPPQKKWGMVIDLSACIGCNACVVACQAENNIPVVGKDQVSRGREMHWLRIDRYVEGPPEQPNEFHFQPVPCMHCENAPCEYVCPVEATVHSAEGLNDMVYNRCVGTRFCSNNCPYKVRRFNFLAYADFDTASLRLQYNPDVTVRSRGVMEKCSYCVQRIRHAEIDAQNEGREVRDGEILTACQAACPATAIAFGDLNDKSSQVRRWKDSPLEYGLLTDLNTNPRTTYLAAVRNPNPALET